MGFWGRSIQFKEVKFDQSISGALYAHTRRQPEDDDGPSIGDECQLTMQHSGGRRSDAFCSMCRRVVAGFR